MTCTSSQLRWQFVFHEWFKCVTFESWDGISSSSFQKKGGPADPMLKGSSDAPFLSLQGNFLELLWFPQTHWGLVSSARKLSKISSSPTGVAKQKKKVFLSTDFTIPDMWKCLLYWRLNTWTNKTLKMYTYLYKKTEDERVPLHHGSFRSLPYM